MNGWLGCNVTVHELIRVDVVESERAHRATSAGSLGFDDSHPLRFKQTHRSHANIRECLPTFLIHDQSNLAMQSTVLNLPVGLLAQVNNSWLTSWLTPVWFLAAGVALGMVVLLVSILLFRLLSWTPWASLSRSSLGHVVAAVVTAALTFAVMWLLPKSTLGDSRLQEPLFIGLAIAMLCAIVAWAFVFCSGRQASKSAWSVLTEGAAGYIASVALGVVVLGAGIWLVGSQMLTAIVDHPLETLHSLPAVFSSGQQAPLIVKLPGKPVDGEASWIQLEMPRDIKLVKDFNLTSTTTVVLGDAAEVSKFQRTPYRLAASEAIQWAQPQPLTDLPISLQDGAAVFAQNQEIEEATVTVQYATNAPVPQAASLLSIALATWLLGLAILLQNAVAPRVSAVSLATMKNELAQPLFLVLMAIGTVLVVMFEFLSFNTFGEDIKLLKDCGITTIMLLAAFQGVWSASSSISEEIEGRTALTVLCKPIQRRSFVVGKFMGLFWLLALMFIVLGVMLLVAVAYKPIYDAREASLDMPTWQACHAEMMHTVPGLAMGFMQAILLTAVSVALATRLPLLANLSVCFAIYVIGNLTTSIVSSTVGAFPIVEFIAQLIATVIPILEHFQLQTAIDADRPITMSLLSGNLIYCLLYILLAMFLALLLFEDRDLA
jgi:ABC-type transport system involved in multi-copper enzyme maturation permease subunit